MLFVPEIDLLINYLVTRSKFNKTDEDLLRQNFFETKSNKIIYSKCFIDSIEHIIDDSNELYDEFSLFVKMMIDDSEEERSVKIELGSLPSQSSVFDELCNYPFADKIVIGVSETAETNRYNNNILNINNIKDGNKNFVYAKLLCGEVCLLRSTFYADRNIIVDVLDSVYSLYPNLDEVIILDRNANVNHNIYDFLVAKNLKFKYYKLYAEIADSYVLSRKLKKFELYSTNNKDLIHERQIIVKDLVINFDEDPHNLVERDTWLITVQFCRKTAKAVIEQKCSLFSKTLFSAR